MGSGRIAVVVALCAMALSACSAQGPAPRDGNGRLNVIAIGDSVTEGHDNTNEYKGEYTSVVTKELLAAGFNSAMYGSMRHPAGDRHEGHSGWCIKDTPRACYSRTGPNTGLLEHVDEWLTASRSERGGHDFDVVILEGGLNDIANMGSDAGSGPIAAERMGELIDAVLRLQPRALIVVMTIAVPDAIAGATTFNASLPKVVDARSSLGARVVLADTTAVEGWENYSDNFHPNQRGYDAIGAIVADKIIAGIVQR